MNSLLPTKVTPCPIMEVVLEIIFSRKEDMEAGAVYGKVYDGFKKEYPKTENLPIFQLPEDIRLHDDAFKNKPWHKFSNENYSVLVGASVVAIAVTTTYPGWSVLSGEVNKIFTILEQTNIVKSINRIGLRYVDKFHIPIVNEINMHLTSTIDIDNKREIQIKTSLDKKDELDASINIINNVTIDIKGEKLENISILDIDIYWTNEGTQCTLDDSKKIFDKAHDYQKELFFKLVQEPFLSKNGFILA